MNKKKREEFKVLEILKENINDFPRGDISPFEKPDFLVHTKENILGIEITQLHKNVNINDPESKANENSRNKIVELVRKKLIREQINNLTISIRFSHSNQDFKLNRENFSNKLVDIILTNRPIHGSIININHYSGNHSLPYEIDSIIISDFVKNESLQVNLPTVGWVQDDFISEMQNLISQKNTKLKEYYSNCDVCWLIIYSSWDDASSYLNPNESTIINKYDSKFSKTFYIGGRPIKCIQLKT